MRSVEPQPLAEGFRTAEQITLRGCTSRAETERERLAQDIFERLHPVMGALGLLFVVLVLAQGGAKDGTALDRVLFIATWVLWAVFVVEYVLRAVIAPSTNRFLRRTWWQLLFLVLPFLAMVRALLVLRLARPTRVALAALRGSRSAAATLRSRAGWIAVVTAIVIFAAADALYQSGSFDTYGAALHAAAMGAISGEPTPTESVAAQLIDVALVLYAAVVFAALAGMLGAYFLERRQEHRQPDPDTKA
jgi:voltage-gated potassium channel